MPPALEVVDFALAAAAATGFQAFAAGTNQTATIRGTANSANVHLCDVGVWTTTQADVTIRSPRLHDATQGILMATRGGEADPTWPLGVQQPLYGQDQLTVGANFNVAPGAAAIQHIDAVIYYEDLGGVSANLRTWAECAPNVIELVGVKVSATSGASPASWGAGVAINSSFDLLKANQLYAVLGFTTLAAVAAVAVQGPDTGNLLCGGPNSLALDDTRYYFKRLSDNTGFPTIPVINSANKSGTNVLVASSAASTAADITLVLAHLSA